MSPRAHFSWLLPFVLFSGCAMSHQVGVDDIDVIDDVDVIDEMDDPPPPPPPPPPPSPGLACGLEMVDLPDGEVMAGCDPAHGATCLGEFVSAFSIDVEPIPRDAYLACVAEGACLIPDEFVPPNPAIEPPPRSPGPASSAYALVSFAEAQQYCAFCGKRLPSEPEWERAAFETGAVGLAMGGPAPEWADGWYTWHGEDFEPTDSSYNSRLVFQRHTPGETYRYGSHPDVTGRQTFRCVSP